MDDDPDNTEHVLDACLVTLVAAWAIVMDGWLWRWML